MEAEEAARCRDKVGEKKKAKVINDNNDHIKDIKHSCSRQRQQIQDGDQWHSPPSPLKAIIHTIILPLLLPKLCNPKEE